MKDSGHKLGLRRNTVSLVPYQKEWKQEGERCISLLRNLLGSAAKDIQHVGSTSVPFLHAKPIIDIVAGIDSYESVIRLIPLLEEHGIHFRGEDVPGQLLFVIGEGNVRTHHIHIVRWKGKAWNDYIFFRDYLSSHPEARDEYAALKAVLAEKYSGDRASYTREKGIFVSALLSDNGHRKAAVM